MSKNLHLSTAISRGQTIEQILATSPRDAAEQATDAILQLAEHSPETVTDLATMVLGATIHFERMRAVGDLTEEGEHVRKFLAELCERAGIGIQLTAIKRESTPEQDHL